MNGLPSVGGCPRFILGHPWTARFRFLSRGWSAFLLGIFLVVATGVVAAPCPHCGRQNPGGTALCRTCLGAVSWPTRPPREHAATVVVRTGSDAFIRSPNDQHPGQGYDDNAGGDPSGALGSYATPTGLRYLVWFDIPRAFEGANLSLKDFRLARATLVLRVLPQPDGRDDLPILIYPLARPFEEGVGTWHRHRKEDGGCTWHMATRNLSWETPGGDILFKTYSLGSIPREATGEVSIDVTAVVGLRFSALRTSGRWNDPGFLCMRDPFTAARCQYRRIYGFQSAPAPDRFGRFPADPVRSPELYLESE